MEDLTDARIRFFYQQIQSTGLPQGTDYISVVGIVPGDGLTSDSGIEPIQDAITRPFIDVGANDGYVEYPGTQFPPELAPRNYTIPVDASHVFIDGTFDGENLSSTKNRRTVIGAVAKQIGEMLEQEDQGRH
jgi:hypothetical protein